jgi:glyceraldehyde 3-phosphate dehydrogenase
MIRIGLNGFGRIGRAFFRQVLKMEGLHVVVINDTADTEVLGHLLKYDSVHGKCDFEITCGHDLLQVNGASVPVLHHTSTSQIPWDRYQVDVVIEATGRFLLAEEVSSALDKGVKKIIFSAPPADQTKTIVYGVNEKILTARDHIISNASCTTNNAAPMLSVLDDFLGIESAYITTVHSYTSDQRLLDSPHKDFRRARAAALSIIPTTTGAAKAVTRIFPRLEGKIGGGGIRVPVPDGSLTDITCMVKSQASAEEINRRFYEVASQSMKGIIEYTSEPLVSVDIIGNTHSCVFDSALTSVLGNMVKVVGWYDNETGYACRLIDLIVYLQSKKWLS